MNFIQKILNTKKGLKVKEVFLKVNKKFNKTSQKVENKLENYLDEKISFKTFLKTEIKLGEILTAQKIKESDRLLLLSVDIGEKEPRQIISGIALSYTTEELIGKKALFVTNLEPRKLFGMESDGMILGISNLENKDFSILIPEKENIKNGTRAS